MDELYIISWIMDLKKRKVMKLVFLETSLISKMWVFRQLPEFRLSWSPNSPTYLFSAWFGRPRFRYFFRLSGFFPLQVGLHPCKIRYWKEKSWDKGGHRYFMLDAVWYQNCVPDLELFDVSIHLRNQLTVSWQSIRVKMHWV